MNEQEIAQELADILMRQPLEGGPLARITGLTRVLRVLKLTARIVAAARNREADALTAVWPYRRIAELSGVNSSTMQGWVNEGAKLRPPVEAQQVSRETMPANG